MARKKIRNLLISTMATALLGTMAIGVASISASAAAYSESNNYFTATGGTYTLTNPTAAAQGVKLGVKPTAANGTVDLSFNAAGRLYNFDKKNYWGGEFHYKMEDPTAAQAVVTTYRSTADQDYSISFITTADGTYVSLTDDVTFQGNVPYANGAATPMTMDWTEDCATLADMVIGFRPTSDPTKPTAYSTTEMFKGGSAYRAFNLLDEDTLTAEAEDAGFYADRYTKEWVEQLCWDMSYGSAIMEISFVGVADAEAGAEISIWTMNGYDYQAYVKGGYNAGTNAIQRQEFDYDNLFVQKSKDVKFETYGPSTLNGFAQLWEVWTPTTETGRAEINTDTSKEYTYLAKDAQMSSYADASLATAKATATTGNNLILGGYHIFRPGLVNPVVYYKSLSHAWAGRFNVLVSLKVSINGGDKKTIFVPDNKEFCLADIEELSSLGCVSGEWVGGSGNFYTAGTTFSATTPIKIHNEWDFEMKITTTDHTESTVDEVAAGCTTVGKSAATVCSVCERVLSGGELVAAKGHEYGEASYAWSADGSTCTASRTCTANAAHIDSETVNASKLVTQEKDCTNDEISTFTATFTNGAFTTQTKEDVKTGDAIGHAYGEASYVWTDVTSCKATKVCANDETHKIEETATGTAITSAVTQNKDCAQDEITTYTATFENSEFVAQTKEAVTDEKDDTNCTYGGVSYAWSADNSTCTASRTCTTNAAHIDSETVNASKSVTQEKDCTNDEISTFTATFTNGAFTTQTKENVKTGDAIGHAYGAVTYTWSADNSTCTATRTCANDGTHAETETVNAVKTVTQEATTSQVELSKFEATFENEAFAKQTKEDVQTGDMLPDVSVPGTSESDSTTSESTAPESTAPESTVSNASSESEGGCSGCSGSLSSLGGVVLVLTMASAAFAIKRRKED